MEILIEIAANSWDFFVDSAPWLIFGFFAAGILHGFVSGDFVASHLGKGRVAPVFKAAALGVPLPLCSCGVLPAAMGLRGKGATKGATVSFLVSTPETGMDSIAVTWALMGPFAAVARPIAAGVSAVVAGLVEAFFEKPARAFPTFSVINDNPGCGGELPPGAWNRFKAGMTYAFGDLLRDLTPWLLFGVALGGVITALVPEGWITAHIGAGWGARFAMLALGVPMYVCATASTPIAAALIMKGLSPGAAFVFLLTGPATNTASILAVTRMLGVGTTVRYLASISLCALFSGWLVDLVVGATGISFSAVMSGPGAEHAQAVGVVGAVALLALMVRSMWTKKVCCG